MVAFQYRLVIITNKNQRWYSLRLLIRKPILQQALSHSNPVTDSLENDITCMQLAHNIIQGFNKIPKERARSIFPFLYYFVTATMISLGLIIKEPSFKATYGNETIQAAKLLRRYCRETWISGRMARTVHRLNRLAAHILNDNGIPGESFPGKLHPTFSGRGGLCPNRRRLLWTARRRTQLSQLQTPIPDQMIFFLSMVLVTDQCHLLMICKTSRSAIQTQE